MEGGIVLVEESVIEPLPHNRASALLDFADVNQHSRNRIDGTGEDKIGDVITTASVARFRFRTKNGQIFALAPLGDMQATRSRKFEALAYRQEHNAIPSSSMAAPRASTEN